MNKITLTVDSYTHSSEFGVMLPEAIEAFEHLLRAAGFVFDGPIFTSNHTPEPMEGTPHEQYKS